MNKKLAGRSWSQRISPADQRLFVGKNADYYMERWISKTHGGWNFSALAWWDVWLGYRRMTGELACGIAVFAAGSVWLHSFLRSWFFSFLIAHLSLTAFFAGAGNELYLRKAQREAAKTERMTQEDRSAQLRERGGVSYRLAAFVLFLNLCFALLLRWLYR